MPEMPSILCLTNTVAANFTANVLLALGLRPVMLEDPDEAVGFVRHSGALLVNLGTVTAAQAETMRRAIAAANAAVVPWVLDPVGCQCLAARKALAEEFLLARPALVRGNRAELACLASAIPPGTATLATGETDLVNGVTVVTGGVAMLARVTATGCAQGAICAALLALGHPPPAAALAASRLLKRAGELAWERGAHRPGAFQLALLDALDELKEDLQ